MRTRKWSSTGRFRIRENFDDGTLFLDGAGTTPRTIDLTVTIGDLQYPGTTSLEGSDLEVKDADWQK